MNDKKDEYTDSTVLLSDIKEALDTVEQEASDKPAAFLAIGGELNGTLFDLTQGTTTIGRMPDNTISLEFKGISRYHMKVEIDEKTTVLSDTGSRNGTYLNNQKIEKETPLKKSDVVKLGSIALKFIPAGDPERLTYEKLNLEANTDGLTKCFNKSYFNNACDLEVRKSKVTGTPLSLILFDIDHFKKLNDTYGHDAGDYVLKALSDLVRENGVRDKDIFARYGGEEFVILLPSTNIKHAYEIAERIRVLIANFKFLYEKSSLPTTISIGLSDYRKGVENGVDLFKRADSALYSSKNSGRNTVNFYRSN